MIQEEYIIPPIAERIQPIQQPDSCSTKDNNNKIDESGDKDDNNNNNNNNSNKNSSDEPTSPLPVRQRKKRPPRDNG